MGFLTDYEENLLVFQGKEYRLDLAYDTVLNVQRMFREQLLNGGEMLVEALRMFGIPEREIRAFPWDTREELLNQIFWEKIQGRPRPKVGVQKRLFDFEDDGEYIYASFLADYGIDLINQRGKLPWPRFLALFEGLTNKTKIREVMRIRDMDLPKPNGKNQKEIQELMQLKAYYALGYREENAKDELNKLFCTLEKMATK
ncbi:MAG TPA: bacteriophage Gp15 family protein [Candidatus Eisenbergiella merdigallinarum]|uniref:Bacteriophage Gp15 family protein n=1 Tax=Candidatus Eisenbergiella merdigallinarum TaxID=2838552 RepID=A0A9D2SCF4_9FIRM|nr:bacteriophage Gp15 family protein [Candidatus Eisenbergiella merdigallinarum]